VARRIGGGGGVRNYISDFEGPQAVPGCPSGIGRAYNRNFLNIFMTLEGVHYSNVGRATFGRNFDVTNGRAAREAYSGAVSINLLILSDLHSRRTTAATLRVKSARVCVQLAKYSGGKYK
jgi:hypothetical protein